MLRGKGGSTLAGLACLGLAAAFPWLPAGVAAGQTVVTPASASSATPALQPAGVSLRRPGGSLPVVGRSASPVPLTTQTAATGHLIAAGDIASCGWSGDEQTAALLDGLSGTVLTLGDNAYPDGTASQFTSCYHPSWGRHKARTRPSPGNHDYHTSGAAGYFGYFGSLAGSPALGYYSFDVGGWHVISLNSEIAMSAGSAQEQWLRADLAAHPADCTVAYWHRPRFSSGAVHGSDSRSAAIWTALYQFQADVVLNGHEHNYERFAPQTPSGTASSQGIRQFVVGTGGATTYPNFGSPVANSVVRNGTTLGVLRLVLYPKSYEWEFVPAAGGTFTDSGSGTCAGASNDAPVVGAGVDQTITLPDIATLSGTVTDDGLPQGATVTSTWSAIDGPGTVTFADPTSPATTATFTQPGTYTLRLTATDTDLTASDEVSVAVDPAAPAPGQGGSAPAPGSGGGGGGSSPDLVLVQSADRTDAAVGDTILFRLAVSLRNYTSSSGAGNLVLTDALPANVEFLSVQTNRGACAGGQVVVCSLDFIAGTLVAVVEIAARVTGPGAIVNTASVRADESDPDPSNNTATVTVSVPVPVLAPPVPAGRAPRLTHDQVALTVRLSRSGAVVAIVTVIRVDGPAELTLTLLEPRSGKRLLLQPRSSLAGVALKTRAATLRVAAGRARAVTVSALLSPRQLRRNGTYRLVVTATSPDGKTSTLAMGFAARGIGGAPKT
jgi:uncharacterized repeat protein (TIGR01451 family)